MADEIELLRSIDVKLGALLSIAVDDLLRRSDDLADPRPRSIDRMLVAAGLSQTETAKLLGKSSQAVNNILSAEKRKKAAKKSAKKATTAGGA